MKKTKAVDPQEEQIDNLPTDVELELEDGTLDQASLSKPYDPTLIRVDPKMYSLRNIIDMIEEGDLDLAPDFQRLKVWKSWQKSRLIESILLRVPLPAFYFSSDTNGTLQVVDGVQRLTTIYDFVKGGGDGKSHFKLTDLEYLENEVGGKSFSQLEGSTWAKRLHSTQIVANVIDPQTPNAVKFDIFKRINTGGSPLTAQEIRHCMSGLRSRALLKRLSISQEFKSATGGKLTGHLRMVDREMVLRVLAFAMQEDELLDVSDTASLEDLLNAATTYIDSQLTDSEMKRLESSFLDSMTAAHKLFGIHAFRKWPMGASKLFPINKALFDVWGVLLMKYAWKTLEPHKEVITKMFREISAKDYFFIASISSSTGDPKKIHYRFLKTKEILEKCLS